jgi:hypothetical protein
MAISPWLQGSRDIMSITLNPIPPSFLTPVLVIRDRTGYLADVNGTGNFGTFNPSTGVVTYQPSAADVATPGDYDLFLEFTDSSGVPYRRQMGEWLVIPV